MSIYSDAVSIRSITDADEDSSSWDSDDSASFTDTESSGDEDEEATGDQHKEESEAHRVEDQQQAAEVASPTVKVESEPIPRKRSTRRRPPPAVPARRRRPCSTSKDLPSLPGSGTLHIDDAYERYEAYRQNSLNRLSLVSVESVSSVNSMTASPALQSSIPRSPSAASASSEHEGRASHFLHFFGRKTPANDGEERVRPVISGPIMQEKEPGTPANESDFGTSWASVVDKCALEDIPAKERKRQEAIFEFIATEAAYVRDLQLIVEVFYTNLNPLLDQRATAVIFANVEDILLTNTAFLSSLEARQKECRLYIDKIGDILKTNISNMGLYTEYCVNQGNAIKFLQSTRESNPEVAACLQKLRDDPAVRNLDLSSYLLIPMQRITRYPLLIKQILHYSEAADERKLIESSLDISEKLLNHINETIREQEGYERLRQLSHIWIGEGSDGVTAPTRAMGPRKLLREGMLMKAKSGRRLRGFLCSDVLVLTDERVKALYHNPIWLTEAKVREVPGSRDDLAFQLVLPYPRGGEKINLKATSARDCQLWMQAIEKASHQCRQAEIRAAKRG